ncbi:MULTISPECIES: NAD(P)/FAD-dependent oxidoreductase [Myroides]|uniref:NAD(P)/FAD-dependent oxidoreductase n=1 Tax=Myroides TaxID=76831 RepID=UPI00057E64AD|nr:MULTISPECIES: NAD(P)/FAD-dependent oxidoreductase [Myroides]AJA69349.1 Thioredoxin reductase [Myroides sp. A21]MDM1401759.1 NAD(P)/FAD-dependent oxidoreductase [Myroides odoratimimus]MEC4036998.1 NAD(P)/FAD-dependent oxidoreductase [Myroides odoratimimus]MEC4094946.1 NAD(P)/FAD-dependent oxidoreductase [Myroides odoratimimus]
MTYKNQYDVIIVGGSYSGLSAAMALGRLLKSVLIIDSGLPCNRQTPHSHNFLTQDGQTPLAIANKAKEQVLAYQTVSFYQGLAVSGKKTLNGFEITTDLNDTFSGKKLIFATGIKDIMPDIKEIEACWGISVIHCPFCHGYEFKDKKTAILADSDKAVHMASLVGNLTKDITVLTNASADFTIEQREKLAKNHIAIIETPITAIKHQNGYLESIVFKDNSKLEVQAMYAAVAFEQHCPIPKDLGCELTETGYIKVDAFQKTSIDGVYACGDNTSMFRSVSAAVASGSMAGAMVVKELTEELF